MGKAVRGGDGEEVSVLLDHERELRHERGQVMGLQASRDGTGGEGKGDHFGMSWMVWVP